MPKYLLLFFLLLLSGCAYTLDGLKPDELKEFNPAECPQAEGWFEFEGELRHIKDYNIKTNLVTVLIHVGVLNYDDIGNNVEGMESIAEPVYLKATMDGMQIVVKDDAGIEKAFNFLYNPTSNIYGRDAGGNRQYCSNGKLLVRNYYFYSNYGDSYGNIYRDAVFRFDDEGLTVTIHYKKVHRYDGLFGLTTKTNTGAAEIFFKAVSNDLSFK